MRLDIRFLFRKEDVTMAAKRFLQIALILVMLAACFAIPRSASAQGPCGSIYIVQPGDWLSKIANRCGVSLSALYAANPGVAYQRYIYPGQALNIPGGAEPVYPVPGPVYPVPGPVIPPQPQIYYPPISAYSTNYWFASMVVTPRVGTHYFWSPVTLNQNVTFQVDVKNNGNVFLQIVANMTPPPAWDSTELSSNCTAGLGTGGTCTLTWVLTPRTLGGGQVRVYVRGLYTDYTGNTNRVTQSPAFFFVMQ
jgi:LysM repeat protein